MLFRSHGVIALGTVGDFPRVNVGILVVIDKTLHSAVEVDYIGISDLFPPTATGRHRGEVHSPDVGGCHLTSLWCRGAMEYEILELCHDYLPVSEAPPACVVPPVDEPVDALNLGVVRKSATTNSSPKAILVSAFMRILQK